MHPVLQIQFIMDIKTTAMNIFNSGLKAVEPDTALKSHCSLSGDIFKAGNSIYKLDNFNKVYVIGGGKAALPMAKAVEDILGDRIARGVVVTKYGYGGDAGKIKVIEAGHPIPNENGVKGGKEIINLLNKTTEKDLVICLISGGGSALLSAPAEDISLKDKQRVTDLLLKCGADIKEINTLRKHISLIKGGRLARIAYPSHIVSLILSDVVDDDLSAIASGPTYPDRTTFKESFEILDKYKLKKKVPETILEHIEKGLKNPDMDTPKEGSPFFGKTENLIIGNNFLALKAAKRKAEELGLNTIILSSCIEGETCDVAKVHTAILKEIAASGNPVKRPACVLSGGETTVTIRGSGKGGRNQEFALAAAFEIQGLRDAVILSGGTDGTDGPTDAAGAFAEPSTIKNAMSMGINPKDYLKRNDSYNFFKSIGGLLVTGPTKTNVMDLRVMLLL